MKYGLIAGNGRFPVLALESARAMGHDVIAIGLEEEASKEIEGIAEKTYWISLGALSRLIDILHGEDCTQVMMCGQVKHAKIFSSIKPDWRLIKLLASMPLKNTDSLIGAVQKILADEGIELVDSTLLLKQALATSGPMTRRWPTTEEKADLDYGRRIAEVLSAHDIGQSVAVCDLACVAVEAMEGTDAMLRRAVALVQGRALRLVKGSRRREHMLYDVPVVGIGTIDAMREAGANALAIDAGRTLMIDKEAMLDCAAAAGIAIYGFD